MRRSALSSAFFKAGPSGHTPQSRSKRNVVLEVIEFSAALGRRLRRRGTRGRALLGAAPSRFRCPGAAAHALARAQHLHLVGDDFRRVLVGPVLVLPLARLQAPFDVDLRALLQVLARDLGELAEERDAMPFRLLLHLAVLVL